MDRDGLIGRALSRIEESTGQTVVPTERLEVLEAYFEDYRLLSHQLDSIGYTVLNYLGNQPQEMLPQQRLRVVQQARVIWMNDPQAGAAVELMNDFVFGRGVPRPRAKDPRVQVAIDKAWDDPDNMEVLTTIDAQLALGTDLALQSNLLILAFGLEDDSGPGVKLSLLRHDDVFGHVAHPDKRHRVLYYLAREYRQEWDYKTHASKPIDQRALTLEPTYYEHWRNVELSREEDGDGTSDDEAPAGANPVEYAPDKLLGKGRVYHLRINRTSEMVFGVPRFQRTMTWYSAYNKYVKDRLDIVAAAAAIIMKRKVKGTPSQLAKDAAKAMSRTSPLASSVDPGLIQGGPRPASIIEENESVQHEAFNLDTRAGNAQQDAQIIRAPISAAERFPQAYFGDASDSNLATATSLELPVLKAVEARQEVFEKLIRWFVDRVIEKAVASGEIPEDLTPEEIPVVTPGDYDPDDVGDGTSRLAAKIASATAAVHAGKAAGHAAAAGAVAGSAKVRQDATVASGYTPPAPTVNGNGNGGFSMQQACEDAARAEREAGRELVEVARVRPHRGSGLRDEEVVLLVSRGQDGGFHYSIVEGYEDQGQDEVDTKRDLSYEFSMPSPLRRMMGDLISAIMDIAQTFDPNNTNPKLSRTLLTVALGEGLEVQDAPDLVDAIFPEGYMDPMVAAQLAAGAAPAPGAPPPLPGSENDPNNPYGAPMQSTLPEDMRSGSYQAQESVVTGRTRGRDGSAVVWTRRVLSEHHDDRPEPVRRQIEGDRDEAETNFSRDVVATALDAMDSETLLPTEG